MTAQVAYRFIEGLNSLEEEGELDGLVEIFSDLCEIGAPFLAGIVEGKDRAREFWRNYRTSFQNVRSTIRNIVIGDTSVALEWTADAINRSGQPLHYDGVSILDTEDGRITRFRTYFDPRAIDS